MPKKGQVEPRKLSYLSCYLRHVLLSTQMNLRVLNRSICVLCGCMLFEYCGYTTCIRVTAATAQAPRSLFRVNLCVPSHLRLPPLPLPLLLSFVSLPLRFSRCALLCTPTPSSNRSARRQLRKIDNIPHMASLRPKVIDFVNCDGIAVRCPGRGRRLVSPLYVPTTGTVRTACVIMDLPQHAWKNRWDPSTLSCKYDIFFRNSSSVFLEQVGVTRSNNNGQGTLFVD